MFAPYTDQIFPLSFLFLMVSPFPPPSNRASYSCTCFPRRPRQPQVPLGQVVRLASGAVLKFDPLKNYNARKAFKPHGMMLPVYTHIAFTYSHRAARWKNKLFIAPFVNGLCSTMNRDIQQYIFNESKRLLGVVSRMLPLLRNNESAGVDRSRLKIRTATWEVNEELKNKGIRNAISSLWVFSYLIQVAQ